MNIIIEIFGKRFGLLGNARKRKARITPPQPKHRKLRRVQEGTYDTPEQFYQALSRQAKKNLYLGIKRRPSFAIHSSGNSGWRVSVSLNNKENRSRTHADIKDAYAFRDRVIQLYKGAY